MGVWPEDSGRAAADRRGVCILVVAVGEGGEYRDALGELEQQAEPARSGPRRDVRRALTSLSGVSGTGRAQSLVGDELAAKQVIVMSFAELQSDSHRFQRFEPCARVDLV